MAKIDKSTFLSTGYLRDYVERITERTGSTWVCPLCGSGTGPKRTGGFSIRKDRDGVDRWRCFKCNKSGDIFDLIGEIEHITDYPRQLEKAKEIFGVEVFTTGKPQRKAPQPATSTDTQHGMHTCTYTQFFEEANRHLGETSYHRGISMETLNRFNVGYVDKWRYPLAAYLASNKATASGRQRTEDTWERIPTSPRLIIPTSPVSYLARDVRSNLTEEQRRYEKSKVGPVHLFNVDVLYNTDKPVFITEGEIDCMTLIDCGVESCAIGSISNMGKLVDMFKKKRPTAKIILALDWDAPGREANEQLQRELFSIGIPSISWDLKEDGFNDANEYVMKGEQGFLLSVIDDALERASELVAAEELEKQEYQRTSAFDLLEPFYDEISNSANAAFLSTGFPQFDYALGGGLFPGLIVLGAISSLGKTTFMQQLCDQVAELNNADVLYFSLEMSKFEMMAKSISRHTSILSAVRTGGSSELAKTARGISCGRFWYGYSQEQKDLIYQAMQDYGEYARHIYYVEGIGDVGTAEIREAIEKHIKMTGRTPLVAVDYLQIVKPASDHMTDKQAVDSTILELKKISRDYKLPLFTVSSFNRQKYKTEVEMASFKESGAIEYSADILLGLQLEGAGTKDFDSTKEKAKLPRQIELLVLKNRNGAVGQTIRYRYDPRFNIFEEGERVIVNACHGKQLPGSPFKMVDVDWGKSKAAPDLVPDAIPEGEDDWDFDLQMEAASQSSLLDQGQAGQDPEEQPKDQKKKRSRSKKS